MFYIFLSCSSHDLLVFLVSVCVFAFIEVTCLCIKYYVSNVVYVAGLIKYNIRTNSVGQSCLSILIKWIMGTGGIGYVHGIMYCINKANCLCLFFTVYIDSLLCFYNRSITCITFTTTRLLAGPIKRDLDIFS